MNSIFITPYKPLWYTILLLISLSILGFGDVVDIQYQNTYLVIETYKIGIYLSIYLALIGLIYWLIRDKSLFQWLSTIHVIITIVTFVLFELTYLLFQDAIKAGFEMFRTLNLIKDVLILVAIVGQLIFAVNLVLGLTKNQRKS